MGHRRPNEYRIELGVTLRLTEVPMHLLLKAPAGPLLSMHLGDPAGEPLKWHRPFLFDNARD